MPRPWSQHPGVEFGLHAHLNQWAVLPYLRHVTWGEDTAQRQRRKKWVRPAGGKQKSMRGLGRKEEALEQRWSTGMSDPGCSFAEGSSPLRGVRVREVCCDSSTHYCFIALAVYLETLV